MAKQVVKVGDKVRAMRPFGDTHGFKSGQVVTVVHTTVNVDGDLCVIARGALVQWDCGCGVSHQDLEPGEYKLAKQAMKRGVL